jgi:hypothetical protein
MTAAAATPPPSGITALSAIPPRPQISFRWLPALIAVTALRLIEATPAVLENVTASALKVKVPFL